ncbi:hypothetical protein Y1Q_0019606 [Alligator mississippiensis]|uniref:ribonuclease H n=1 Tax=Alligator mississippiensis TaxID=8496 RepID=A0A151PEQ7_ALLMI|nr:hypothetical protein Y1Q_0019606 [Alligator mississippiensis]
MHTIKTPPGAIVREKWRPILHHLLDAVREEVNSMLQLGVVRPSRSPWRSPLVPVRKPDGSLRLCVDYRRLNALATFDAFPMPQIDELIEKIGEAQYISTLDLAKGYWQIPVASADWPKMAFGTPWGLYEFVKMPFGLHGAAATFQRLMDRLLAPHAEYAVAYIDDIIIYSPTWTHHKQALWAVLSELRRAGLTANPRKCTLAKRETKYLGFLTDASETAVGAVLTQEEKGTERQIAYASRKLTQAEKRYATIERECLAIRCNSSDSDEMIKPQTYKADNCSGVPREGPLDWIFGLRLHAPPSIGVEECGAAVGALIACKHVLYAAWILDPDMEVGPSGSRKRLQEQECPAHESTPPKRSGTDVTPQNTSGDAAPTGPAVDDPGEETSASPGTQRLSVPDIHSSSSLELDFENESTEILPQGVAPPESAKNDSPDTSGPASSKAKQGQPSFSTAVLNSLCGNNLKKSQRSTQERSSRISRKERRER